MITDWRGERRIGREPLGERLQPLLWPLRYSLFWATLFAPVAMLLSIWAEMDGQLEAMSRIPIGSYVSAISKAWAFFVVLWCGAAAMAMWPNKRTAAVVLVMISVLLATVAVLGGPALVRSMSERVVPVATVNP